MRGKDQQKVSNELLCCSNQIDKQREEDSLESTASRSTVNGKLNLL